MRPLQPLYRDSDGVIRFESNKIVKALLATGKLCLNDIAQLDFSQEDREQFAQLIGYPLSDFEELSYVSDSTYELAEKMSKEIK